MIGLPCSGVAEASGEGGGARGGGGGGGGRGPRRRPGRAARRPGLHLPPQSAVATQAAAVVAVGLGGGAFALPFPKQNLHYQRMPQCCRLQTQRNRWHGSYFTA